LSPTSPVSPGCIPICELGYIIWPASPFIPFAPCIPAKKTVNIATEQDYM
jgi:hypothetical protein